MSWDKTSHAAHDEVMTTNAAAADGPSRENEKVRNALTALREYGAAVRGDWGDIDGRCVQGVLDSLADSIEGKEFGHDWPLDQWRSDLGLCPSGEGHWTRHCQPITTIGEGEDAYTYGCGNEPTRW